MNGWLVAARPPTLLASVSPVLVGSGLAAGDGVLRPVVFAVTLATAVLINLAANFANDAADAARGADTEHRIGPQRAVATGLLTPRQVWTGTALALGLAAAGGAYLAWVAGWVIIAIGVAAVGATLAYTAGPWPFGYHGLGEVFVFGFFGIAAVVGSRYVHDSTAPLEAWLLAVPVGLLAAAILVANNVRDIDTDRVAGKHTLAVIIGRPATRVLFAVLVVGSLVCIAGFGGLGMTPRPTLIALVASPLAVAPVRTVLREQAGPPLITALRATALLHLAVGVLLALGAAA